MDVDTAVLARNLAMVNFHSRSGNSVIFIPDESVFMGTGRMSTIERASCLFCGSS
jgi:hypothetical protein